MKAEDKKVDKNAIQQSEQDLVMAKLAQDALTDNTKSQPSIEEKKTKKAKKVLAKDFEKIKAKSRKTFADFKKFAFKGNIIDLAIAVIIGAAFGKIISSLVGDVVMPCIGAIIGDINFSDLKIVFSRATYKADGEIDTPENALRYGQFIQTIIEFFIIAISIYIMFKVVLRLRKMAERKKAQEPPPEPKLTTTEQLLTDIKELLTKNNTVKTE